MTTWRGADSRPPAGSARSAGPSVPDQDRQVIRELSEEVLPAEMYGGGA
ncbi:MAG: hypothetical protein ACRDH8_12620 [Actinomycetota bacterium]